VHLTPVQRYADLSLSLVANTQTPTAGSNVMLTVTVQNGGPDTANGVAVRMVLPAGLTFVSADPAAAYAAGTGRWSLGTLATGAPATLTVVATIGPTAVDVVAEVCASNAIDPDSTPCNGVATEDDYGAVHLSTQHNDIIVNDNGTARNPN